MRIPLRQAVAEQQLLISDGALGTELQRAGLEPGNCGDEWNLIHPERVGAIHAAYVAAGSQLITTNTFNCSRFVLANYELENRQVELCRAGVELARQAAGEDRWVMGEVGPCGGFLPPLGSIAPEELEASVRVQIGTMLEAGADAIICETFTALEELQLVVRVAREMRAPFLIASLAYDHLRGGYRTMMGISPQQAANALAAQVDVMGANCGAELTPADFVAIAQAYREITDRPLLLQPNGGKPQLHEGQVAYPSSPEEMAPGLLALTRVAKIVGGCCGTTPAYIRAFRESYAAAQGASGN